MSLQTFPGLIQGSDEWHDQRRGMVTASTVGRLISVRHIGAGEVACPSCDAPAGDPCRSKVKRDGVEGAPIKTAHTERTVYASANRDSHPPVVEPASGDEARGFTALITAERITGYTDPTYINDDMLRGIEDEPLAIDVYSEHYAPVTTIGFMVRDDWGFKIGYSPDGLVGDDGLIEVKSRRQKTQLTTIVSGEVPVDNMAQLQCGLLVSGRKWCDYVTYCGGMPMWVKRVTPDPYWFEAILAAVEKFEKASADMRATYNKAIEGFPMTRRIDLEMVI